MTKTFRLLVLAALGLYVLWFFFPYLDPFIFGEERLAVWGSSGFDAKLVFPVWYPYFWLAYWVVVAYGLYSFFRWSRDALIFGYIIGFFLEPVYGTTIQSPISEVLNRLNVLIDGIVIGMAYFSPVAERFKKTATSGVEQEV